MSSSSFFYIIIAMFTPIADAPTFADKVIKDRRSFLATRIEHLDDSIQHKESFKRYAELRLSRFESRIIELNNDHKIDNLHKDAAELAKKSSKAIISDIRDKSRRSIILNRFAVPSQETVKKSIDAVKQFKRVNDSYFKIAEFDEEELQKYIDAAELLKTRIDRLEQELQLERETRNEINGELDGPPLSAVKKLNGSIVALEADTSRVVSVRNEAVKARQPQVAELLRQRQEASRRQALELARQRMWNQVSGRPTTGVIVNGNSWIGAGGRRSVTGAGSGVGSSSFGCDVPVCLSFRR